MRTVLGLQNHTIQRTSLGIGRVDNMHMCVTVQNGCVGVVSWERGVVCFPSRHQIRLSLHLWLLFLCVCDVCVL